MASKMHHQLVTAARWRVVGAGLHELSAGRSGGAGRFCLKNQLGRLKIRHSSASSICNDAHRNTGEDAMMSGSGRLLFAATVMLAGALAASPAAPAAALDLRCVNAASGA